MRLPLFIFKPIIFCLKRICFCERLMNQFDKLIQHLISRLEIQEIAFKVNGFSCIIQLIYDLLLMFLVLMKGYIQTFSWEKLSRFWDGDFPWQYQMIVYRWTYVCAYFYLLNLSLMIIICLYEYIHSLISILFTEGCLPLLLWPILFNLKVL